ncbi:hypothetical protein BDN72DRAFT_289828 [Pluteus cervinus]|uniref:Uncharacterized protein n=1 Tax=Pluteus cervinus TaxID=181527 RepID=A0ACD3AFC0_9AGAR|nr:hypothetical protein BDN72DRAFT_289828 [Pluteus cervinus]
MDVTGSDNLKSDDHGAYNVVFNYSSTPSTIQDRFSSMDFLRLNGVPSAMFDSLTRTYARRVHGKNRTLLVDQTLTWVQDRKHGGVRYIVGHSGVGKTTLAQAIADRCDRMGQPVASFFFSRSDPAANHTKRLVSTLAYQLANQGEIYTDHIVAVLKRSPSILEKSVDIQWSRLIIDTSQRPSPNPIPLVIVLDGLDECQNKDEQVQFLQLLFTTQAPLVKIIITFRPASHIRKVLPSSVLHSECFITLGNSPDDQHDIREFLQYSFQKISNEIVLEMGGNGDWVSDTVREKLVDMASGQFSFAAAVLSFIDGAFANPRTLLEDVLACRSQAVRPLDSAYLTDMQRLMADIPPEHHTLTNDLITFLALHQSHQSHPFPILSISAFWSAEPFGVRRILNFLDSEVVVSDDSMAFRHQSFLNFLLSPTFPHPFQRHDTDFSAIAIRSLRIMSKYKSVEEADAGIIDSTFAQWLYQCASSRPVTSMISLLLRMDRDMWLDWAVAQPWSSIDPAYARFISWLRSQYFFGWIGRRFPPQLLFNARREWLRRCPDEVVRELVDEDLRSLYDQGEINAGDCLLLVNILHEQVLTHGDTLKQFGSDKTENIAVLRQILDSEDYKTTSQRFPQELLPFEDRPWDILTKSPVRYLSLKSLWNFLKQSIGLLLGLIYYTVRDSKSLGH